MSSLSFWVWVSLGLFVCMVDDVIMVWVLLMWVVLCLMFIWVFLVCSVVISREFLVLLLVICSSIVSMIWVMLDIFVLLMLMKCMGESFWVVGSSIVRLIVVFTSVFVGF